MGALEALRALSASRFNTNSIGALGQTTYVQYILVITSYMHKTCRVKLPARVPHCPANTCALSTTTTTTTSATPRARPELGGRSLTLVGMRSVIWEIILPFCAPIFMSLRIRRKSREPPTSLIPLQDSLIRLLLA